MNQLSRTAIEVVFAAACLLLPLSAVNAAPLRFDASNSTLVFTGSYEGEPVPGEFTRFNGEFTLDPSQPLALGFTVEIDIASLDTQYDERDDVLRSAEWFDAAGHPSARWVSKGACTAAGAALSCPGQLSLRGVTRPVAITVSLADGGKTIRGSAQIDRRQFGVGSGEWDDPATIADQVQVEFELKPAS